MQSFATAGKQSRASRKTREPGSSTRKRNARQQNARQASEVRSILSRGSLQTKLKVGKANDALERDADRAAERVVSMPRAPIAGVELSVGSHAVLQPKCARCEEELQRQPEEDEEEELLQAKKNPGLSPQLSAEQALTSGLSDGPGRPLSHEERSFYEPRFGHDFSRVRVHDGLSAARAAGGISARAFTHGHNVVFGHGERNPHSRAGRLLMAHELAHVIQQGQAAPLNAGSVDTASAKSSTVNRFPADRSATNSLQRSCACGGTEGSCSCGNPTDSEVQLKAAPEGLLQCDFLDDLGDFAGDVIDDPLGTAGALYDEAVDVAEGYISRGFGIGREVAQALGGDFYLDGDEVVIQSPSFDPCPDLDFAFQLSDLGLDPRVRVPVVAGALGIGIVDVIGLLSAEVALDPGFGINLAGCNFGPVEVRIDVISGNVSIRGNLSVTGAGMVSLGGDLGVAGDVFVLIAWPDPPFVIVVPAAGLSVGGSYQFMFQIGGRVSGSVFRSLGLSGAAAADKISADIGLALDFAYGMYGSLRVAGLEMCRVGWPMDRVHYDGAIGVDISSSLSFSRSSGVGISLGMSVGTLPNNPLDQVGFDFDDSRLEDNCPLCDFFRNSGWMPSQNGIHWASASYQAKLARFGGPHPDIMARDPGLTSGAKCRGTCGVDCPPDNCEQKRDLVECEERGKQHVWHVYAGYATCGYHQGCLDHDACYDHAAEMPIWGFGGVMFGPMYRVCDLEAMCDYGFQQAVGWAMGGGPYDGRLRYADSHKVKRGCLGPCPETATVGPEGQEREVQRTCLDPYPLIGRRYDLNPLNRHWSTGNIRLWEQPIAEPPIATAELYARAEADAEINIGLGPASLTEMCLIYDPNSETYSGTAKLLLDAYGEGVFALTGFLGGGIDFASLDILRVACAEGYVRAVATPRLHLAGSLETEIKGAGFDQDGDVPVNCAGGRLNMNTGLLITPELRLTLGLQAGVGVQLGLVAVDALTWEVWEGGPWQLAEQTWEKGWPIQIELPALAAGVMPAAVLADRAFDLDELLGWLMNLVSGDEVSGGETEESAMDEDCAGEPPGSDNPPELPPGGRSCETVVENELTLRSALRIPGIASRLDQRVPTSKTLTLPSGGSAAVGTSMETEYLTNRNRIPSNPRGVQEGIYGFAGLPQTGAFNRSQRRGIKRISYIKGHLLRGEFGGPNAEENFYPITSHANNPRHFNDVERPVERIIGGTQGDLDGKVAYYQVVVDEKSSPTLIDVFGDGSCTYYYINAEFDCTWHTYKLCADADGNEYAEPNPSTTVPVDSTFESVSEFIRKVRQAPACVQRRP